MRLLSLFSNYVLIVVGLVLGVRLMRMWRRTRKLPELLFGLQFLVAGSLATIFFLMWSHYGYLFSPQGFAIVYLLAGFTNSVSAWIKLVTVWRIFRPGRLWAVALMTVLGTIVVAGFVGYLTGHGTGSWGAWAAIVGQVGIFGWMAAEALAYHFLLRRRLRLGLADPVVTNRLLLWGCSAVCLTVMWVLFGLAIVVPLLSQPSVMGLYISMLGLTCSALNWLAFYPPEAYLRFISRGSGGTTVAA